jgi:hypothetical protein
MERRPMRGLADLGRAADAPIVPEAFAKLARAAEAESAVFLPSGAGGGDTGLYVGCELPSSGFMRIAHETGMTPLPFDVDRGGVRIQN